MRVPVLAYHAVNIAGNDYAGNDLVAFAADLRLIDDLGLRIVPLHWVVEQLTGAAERDLDRCLALTCDDGSAFDFHDLVHPAHGPQRSLYHCMLDFVAERGADAQPDLHLTSFVIASPEARERMDQVCLAGLGWMGDEWWRDAAESGLIAIENHSWDHNHPCLDTPGVDGMPRGSFLDVDNHVRAEAEIAAATRFIEARIAPRPTRIFCYPFSHVPEYVHREYLPQFGHEHGMTAAMGDGAMPVTTGADRWNLPRYICGWHWKSTEALRGILAGS
ncbi:MAG: polysaccharide deacetylase family protein [Dokdonella sp.]|uniref:polysaccharide deacetylase family protein n=1 Tax=Dokdonella sp. TaxID=2291710 RepID=UPI003BB023F4